MSSALNEAVHLPVDERLALIEALWNSLVDEMGDDLPMTGEQSAELDRRLAAHEARPDDAVPWDEVRARLPGAPRR